MPVHRDVVALIPSGSDGATERAPRFRHPGADRGGPVDLAAARRILAVRPDNVGDVVLTTPALRAVRAAAPRARLDLLASPVGAAVAEMIPELDGVLIASPSWQQLPGPEQEHGSADRERDLLDRLTAGGYDVMLVFTSFSQSPWPVAHLGLLAGIGTRVVHSREFGGAVATHWIAPPPDSTHHVDRSLHLLAAIGVPLEGRRPALRIPAAAEQEADRVLARVPHGVPGPFALLAPGASCPSRRYPPERFGAAAAGLAAAGLPVLVSGSPGEGELVDRVVRAAGHPDVTALPAVALPVVTAVVRRAAVALTNNSGGLHLADAVGTPVVATYAGTERLGDVRPRSVPHQLLQVPVACSPCRQLACPFHHECLDVPAAALTAAALRLAGRTAGPIPIDAPPDPQEDRWTQDPLATPPETTTPIGTRP